MTTNTIDLTKVITEEDSQRLNRILYEEEFERAVEEMLYNTYHGNEQSQTRLTLEDLRNKEEELYDAIEKAEKYIDGYKACHSEAAYIRIQELQEKVFNGEHVDLTQEDEYAWVEVLHLNDVIEKMNENLDKIAIIDKIIQKAEKELENNKLNKTEFTNKRPKANGQKEYGD